MTKTEMTATERARKAAAARWNKERIYGRIETIAAGFRAANPELTEAAAIARAINENPGLYAAYIAAASSQPALTHEEMRVAYETEIKDLCVLGDRPGLATYFIGQGTHPRDVMKYLIATRGGEVTA